MSASYLQRAAPAAVVVIDNIGAPRPQRMAEQVAAAGCELVFLPACSPALSPVEEPTRQAA